MLTLWQASEEEQKQEEQKQKKGRKKKTPEERTADELKIDGTSRLLMTDESTTAEHVDGMSKSGRKIRRVRRPGRAIRARTRGVAE